MSGQPAFDALAAAEEILVALREHLQQLELREARQGYNTPPDVLTEIERYRARIREQEAEVARLQTEGAVDRYSLNEARYRKSLAQAWTTADSKLSVESIVSLDLQRLELGILPERARQLQQEIREALAEDLFYKLSSRLIPKGDWMWSRESRIVTYIMRLDPATAIRLLLHYTQVDISHELDIRKDEWLDQINAWPGTEDYATLVTCFEQLITAVRDQRDELGPQPDHSFL